MRFRPWRASGADRADARTERTFAWLNRLRRLAIRYERRADLYHAFTALGCSLICFNALQGRF